MTKEQMKRDAMRHSQMMFDFKREQTRQESYEEMSDAYYVIERASTDGMWLQSTFYVSSYVWCGCHLFSRRCDAEACLVIYLSGKRIDKSVYDCKDLRKTKTFAHILSKKNMADILERCSNRYRVTEVKFDPERDDPHGEYVVSDSLI